MEDTALRQLPCTLGMVDVLTYCSLDRLKMYVAVCSLVSKTTDSAAHALRVRYFCIIPHDHKDRLRLSKALVGCADRELVKNCAVGGLAERIVRCWFLFARAPGKGYKD